ncbi:hypothetical protein C0J52_03258 [Blattella germanica]|nr:hypothetical protein C0J52_03258 [Blattella germanica]PSN50861.1 hypothetical protein C0J52_03258 [Blattella germanica]
MRTEDRILLFLVFGILLQTEVQGRIFNFGILDALKEHFLKTFQHEQLKSSTSGEETTESSFLTEKFASSKKVIIDAPLRSTSCPDGMIFRNGVCRRKFVG